jgi:RNA polymerase primary sigma factor
MNLNDLNVFTGSPTEADMMPLPQPIRAARHFEECRQLPHVFHESFELPEAERMYGQGALLPDDPEHRVRHMPDEATRATAKQMHYAAFRANRASDARAAAEWRQQYYALRDRVILGNRKLVFRAVHRQTSLHYFSDDLIGECDLVLIKVVEAYNPWLGIRFSTYAYTCLLRALGRLSRRLSVDRLARSLSLDLLSEHDGQQAEPNDSPIAHHRQRLDEFLRDEHPLLTPREKIILTRRYVHARRCDTPTLEEIGRDLGISKERVRQVQSGALNKLRSALLEPANVR